MKYFLTLVKQDLFTKIFHENYLINLVFSTLLIMLSLYITNNQILNVSTIILPFAIACIIQNKSIFNDESHTHYLEQIIVSGCAPYIIALAKFVVTYFNLCVAFLVILFVFFLLGNTALEVQIKIFKIFLIYSISLSSTALLSSALTIKTKSNYWLGLLISFPLMLLFFMYLFPILSFYLEINNIPNNISTDLQIFCSLSIISFVISIFACSYLISKI